MSLDCFRICFSDNCIGTLFSEAAVRCLQLEGEDHQYFWDDRVGHLPWTGSFHGGANRASLGKRHKAPVALAHACQAMNGV
eukprot:5265271-Amphidinium_carterae.2